MPVKTVARRTIRFIEPGLLVAIAAVAIPLVALVVSGSFRQTLVSRRVQVSPGEQVEIGTVQLQKQELGALRVNASAILSSGRWVSYEMQLRDGDGQVLAAAISQARPGNVEGEFNARLHHKQQDTLTVVLSVLKHADRAGRDLNQPVSFRVNVDKGVVDSRYLTLGWFGTLILGGASWLAARLPSGSKAIEAAIDDSDLGRRAVVGGKNNLVRVRVQVLADETAPRNLEVRLWVKDANGKQIDARSLKLEPRLKRDEDGEIDGAWGEVSAYFLLEPRTSYGFYVEVAPDAPIDRTELRVYEYARTATPVEVIQIATT